MIRNKTNKAERAENIYLSRMIQEASEQAKNKTKNRKILQESHDHVMSNKCELQ